MRLLVIEGIPKKDMHREGLVLSEFLRMTIPGSVDFHRFKGSIELLSFLEDYDMTEIEFIHLSGHGSVEGSESKFLLPKGFLRPWEFPEDCFEECVVTISACELGKKSFADSFIEQTGAIAVIAPQREVSFIDSAFWFIHFYYYALHHEFRPGDAFDRTDGHLSDRVRGGFQYWMK